MVYTPGKSEVQASVVVTFQDLEMTMNAAFGRVDPLIDPPQGRLLIEGRLPLLEKVAYVSRLVEKNLPFPANSPCMHTNSTHLFERAKKVIPGGIYGHVSPSASLPDCFPFYCQSASGYNFIDVDGNQWIDFMCGFGAILHGFNNQEIEEAALKQRSLGAVFNQPSGVMVDLAEAMVDLIDFSNWVVLQKMVQI